MSRHDAVKALNVYKRAGQQVYNDSFFRNFLSAVQYGLNFLLNEVMIFLTYAMQAENLADFYEYCKGLDLARNFQFPTLRQVLFVS